MLDPVAPAPSGAAPSAPSVVPGPAGRRGRERTRRASRSIALVALLVLALVHPYALAQLAVPDSPAGRWAADFLDLQRARDAEGLQAFARERIAPGMSAMLGGPERAARELAALYSGLGPLAFERLVEGDPTVLYARGILTGGWVALYLQMEPGSDPSRAARLAIALDERPPGTPPTRPVADEALEEVVGSYLERLASHDLFSGVVVIDRDGETLYEGAFGRANTAGDPVTLDTGFALVSTAKMFTAVAVLTLVEDGRISLDDPVAAHLPVRLAPTVSGVTIRHLLTHGSGLGTFDLDAIRDMRTIEEMLTLPIEPPAFAPGTRYRYSNVGYLLLGAVVESASGEDFYEYLDEHVFGPAGMTRSGGFELAGEPAGIATGFLRLDADGGRPDDLDLRVRRGSPAADLVSTGPDLVRFGRALAEGTIVGEPLRTEMTTPQRAVHARPGSRVDYGFGVFVENRDGVVSVGHGGGASGASTSFALYPDEGITLVVLSNYELIGDVVARRLKELMGLR